MNTKKFSEAMGEIDSKYVEKAINYKPKQKKHSWLKWGIMAACLCLVIVGVAIWNNSPRSFDNIAERRIGNGGEDTNQTDTEENISTYSVTDYPAAIMVNDTIYLMEVDPMPIKVDESAIIGYTESYTDAFPEKNGETNFNRELGMPYAQVDGEIVVLYEDEWRLCTPYKQRYNK